MPADADSVLLPSYATLTDGPHEWTFCKESGAIRNVLLAELASDIERLDEITDQMDMLLASGFTVSERTNLLALKDRVDAIIQYSLGVLERVGAD